MIKETHVNFYRKFEKFRRRSIEAGNKRWKRVCSTTTRSLYVDVENQIKIKGETANVRGEDREHLGVYSRWLRNTWVFSRK